MKYLTMSGVVFLLLCAGGTRVEAQEVASSFDQLAVLVKPGDRITVVDVTGRETKGQCRVGREAPSDGVPKGKGSPATSLAHHLMAC